jgi:glycosyltransferase involved in cell wall biosynthesis
MPVSELLSILVPVCDESRTVASVIDRLMIVDLPAPRELFVINDGSSDGARQVLDALLLPGDTVRIFHVERNAGKGAAIRLGL